MKAAVFFIFLLAAASFRVAARSPLHFFLGEEIGTPDEELPPLSTTLGMRVTRLPEHAGDQVCFTIYRLERNDSWLPTHEIRIERLIAVFEDEDGDLVGVTPDSAVGIGAVGEDLIQVCSTFASGRAETATYGCRVSLIEIGGGPGVQEIIFSKPLRPIEPCRIGRTVSPDTWKCEDNREIQTGLKIAIMIVSAVLVLVFGGILGVSMWQKSQPITHS
jgi:hypothetical protein